ncbi:MAG: hypothetical protein IPN20_05225 [Haliscomenobacter sp.]|nr:hypothetical protein [Haliscomenobacter sp.]MBK8653285.1 hypothetical protein [Haliscomenobacter sp.]
MAKFFFDLTKFSLFTAKPVVKQGPETRQTESVLEEAVKEIHQEEPPKTAKPAPTSKPAAEEAKPILGRASTREIGDIVRLSIHLPKPLAKRAKRKIIDLEMTMIEYVTRLIEKDLEE